MKYNATITGTILGSDIHNLMTYTIFVKYLDEQGCTHHQGFGAYVLSGDGIMKLKKLLYAIGVENWEDLVGKACRIKKPYNQITKIGHLHYDRWFCYDDEQ